jgi:hypothetical protein
MAWVVSSFLISKQAVEPFQFSPSKTVAYEGSYPTDQKPAHEDFEKLLRKL